MKKHLIMAILIFISNIALAQWTGITSLSFTIQTQSQMNACVDVNGIHLIYWRNGGIKYARASYNGSTVYSYNVTIESEGANSDYASIVSVNNSTLYAVYKKNNTINIKQSTNLGNSWSQYSYRSMTYSDCDKIVAYSEGSDIHIGWTEGGHSHYIKFVTTPSPNWTYYKNVTENEYGGGNDPDLTFSENEIHYLYKDASSDSHSRDKAKTSDNWESPQSIPFTGTSIEYHKPIVANNEINAGFRVYYSSWQTSGAFISNSDRPFNQGYWNANVWLRESEVNYSTEVESTIDNKIHYIYYDKYDKKWEHRYVSNSTLSGQIGEIPLVAYPSSTLLANSNDLYLLALGSVVVPTSIKLQRYDAAPGSPQNLSVTQSANNHPNLTWTANTEPDRYVYNIYKQVTGDWSLLVTISNNWYEDVNESYCIPNPPAQCTNERIISYKVTAVDLGAHESDPSNIVDVRVEGGGIDKANATPDPVIPSEYSLSQNYPNPFNPTTTISYSIKSAGLVTLKVYDMLGTEVASLVNENKEAGNYSVTFNAVNLPSGIYVYRLQINDYTDIHKMILLK